MQEFDFTTVFEIFCQLVKRICFYIIFAYAYSFLPGLSFNGRIKKKMNKPVWQK